MSTSFWTRIVQLHAPACAFQGLRSFLLNGLDGVVTLFLDLTHPLPLKQRRKEQSIKLDKSRRALTSSVSRSLVNASSSCEPECDAFRKARCHNHNLPMPTYREIQKNIEKPWQRQHANEAQASRSRSRCWRSRRSAGRIPASQN